MAAKLLTARSVATAPPKRTSDGKVARAEYADAACPGLYLIVQPGGGRSWALRYRRPDGKNAKLTLGNASEAGLSLAAARHAASAARLRLEQGNDPSPRRLAVTSYDPESGDAIEVAIASFLEKHARRKNRPATIQQAESVFTRLVLPVWSRRSVKTIRRRDVIDLIEQIAIDRGGYMSNRALGVLSKFFNWLVARDMISVSPVAGVERTHQEQSRDRVLIDEELRALWLACEHEGAFGAALRVLVLTGQRKNEVCLMRWSEIDEAKRLWVIPATRAKNGIEHRVPLSAQAWAIIKALPRFVDNDHVFAGRAGRGAINGGWAKAKSRIARKADVEESAWRLHDLRRTAASGLQALGVKVEVIETALNHKSGVFRGIVGTYQRHDFIDEIGIALQRWGDHIERLVGGKPATVVSLRSKRR
jgi:integrase